MEDLECPSCRAITVVTHRIILNEYAICEIRYQCGAEIKKTILKSVDKTSSYTWIKTCYLRKPD